MHFFWSEKRKLISRYVAVLTCVLVASFGLHTIEINHSHPGHIADLAHHGDSSVDNLAEYLHGSNKQDFFLVLVSLLSLGVYLLVLPSYLLVQVRQLLLIRQFVVTTQSMQGYRFFDVYQELFSGGVLHCKVH